MKTLGRIVIIIIVFALVMGITYVAVNATSSSSTGPQFARGDFNSPDGDRPQFPQGARPDFGERREDGNWIFGMAGMVKNIVIIAVIVAMIVGVKNYQKSARRNGAVLPTE